MVKIQEAVDGRYSINLKKDLVRFKGWMPGGTIDFAIVDNDLVTAKPGDVVIRYTPPIPPIAKK